MEQHWNGSLLESSQTVLNFAKSMTFRGIHPIIKHGQKVYHAGVKLTSSQMQLLEARFERLTALPKWFVRIAPLSLLSCSDILLE